MNKKKKHSTLSNLVFAISWQFRVAPFSMLYLLFEAVSSQVIALFEHTFLIAHIINCVEKGLGLKAIMQFLIPVALIVTILQLIGSVWTSYMEPKFQAKMKKAVHLRLYEKAVSMDISKYDDSEFYNDFVWAMQKAPSHMLEMWNTFSVLASYVAVAVVAGVYVVSQDMIALAMALIIAVSTYVIQSIINKWYMKREEELLPVSRRRDYINRVFYLTDFVKDLKMSRMSPKLEKDFEQCSNEMESLIQKHGPKISALSVVGASIGDVVYAGFYLTYLFYQALVLGRFGLGSLLGIYNSTNQMGNKLAGVVRMLPQFQQHSLYIEKMRTFLEAENSVSDTGTVSVPDAGDIVLEDVVFTYPENEQPTINGVSMNIRRGEKIALVGFNGAGKSTLIKLILRLYDPDSGCLRFASNCVGDYPIAEYRNRFGVLFQDFEIIATDVKHNVNMSEDVFDEKRADEIFQKVAFAERLATLPDGYDTQLTKEFDDKGINLSGGEAQKIALARVLYTDANIIILDEPSSALDPIAEYQLNKAVTELAEDKTVIIISHRLSTTRFVDTIYMMEQGKIIEQGNHKTLLARKGKYAEMFELQAEKYR